MYQFYEYVWDIAFMIPNRNVFFQPYSLVEFQKKCDYSGNFIPSYEMTCKVYDKHLDYFRMFDKEIFVRIKQYIFYGQSLEAKTNRELVFEDTFAVYIDKSQLPSLSRSTRKTSSQKVDEMIGGNTYETNTVNAELPVTLRMHLLLRTDLQMKTYIHNYVFGTEDKPVTPATAAAACINLNPYVKKFLMDAPDNNTAYSDLIVESGDLKQVLYGIQRKYGIYNKSMSLFFDNGTLYMLSKLSTQHTKAKGDADLINIRICERPERTDIDESALIDSKGNVYYKRFTTLFKRDTESISSVLDGDKFVYSNFGTVVNSMFASEGETSFISPLREVDKPRPGRQDVGVKKILDYDMLNNDHNMESFMAERSTGVPIGFNLASINPAHFAPNKHVKVSFDTSESNKLYNGIYNIQSADFIFKTLNRPNVRFRTYGHVSIMLFNKHDGLDKDYWPEKPD